MDWEMNGIEVHGVKFTMNQLKKYFKNLTKQVIC